MNKKVLVGIVVILVVVGGYFAWNKPKTTPVDNSTADTSSSTPLPAGVSKDAYAPVTKDTTDNALISRLQSASVSAGETGVRVALVSGKGSFSADDVKGTITLGDVAVSKTINGTTYALTTLAVNSGGSGTFWYVVLFEDKNGTLTDTSYALVGDRVKVTGVRADEISDASGKTGIVVSTSYLDHDKGEPLAAAPTVPRTKIFVVSNGVFDSAKEISL